MDSLATEDRMEWNLRMARASSIRPLNFIVNKKLVSGLSDKRLPKTIEGTKFGEIRIGSHFVSVATLKIKTKTLDVS